MALRRVYTLLYTLQTYARQSRAPPRPVESKDTLLLLPRAPHKGHAAIKTIAAQVVAVHTYQSVALAHALLLRGAGRRRDDAGLVAI